MWKIVSASVVGTSHIKSTLPCQDCAITGVVCNSAEQNYLVCIVADGAGSAKKGGEGAEIACISAVSSIRATLNDKTFLLNEIIVKKWIRDVQVAIQQDAIANKLTNRDYACTLLGAVISEQQALFFQIGDGAIVASNGYTQGIIFWPDTGMYANMTYFVTEKDAMEHLHTTVTNNRINEIALFSDGLQRLALSFEQHIPHAPFFDPMLEVMRNKQPNECAKLDERLALFLDSSNINERTDDDKTLILATRLLS
jgi:hypothetical protein